MHPTKARKGDVVIYRGTQQDHLGILIRPFGASCEFWLVQWGEWPNGEPMESVTVAHVLINLGPLE